MGLLQGKKGLIIGVANAHSIAWGIAKALHAEGAELAFTYRHTSRERRVRPLAESLGSKLVMQCDVQDDDQITALIDHIRTVYGRLDIIIHGAVLANRDELNGPYLTATRAGFRLTMDVSVYSLIAVTRAAQDILTSGASIITLTYHGSRQVVQNYNIMGVAKAALEASVRYLAYDLGSRNIRVNAISAGPIRTVSASAIAGFRATYKAYADIALLRRNPTIAEVGDVAVWLCSEWSSAVTGETIYADVGLHHLATIPRS